MKDVSDYVFIALILICLMGGFMRFLDWCRDLCVVVSDFLRDRYLFPKE